LSYNCIIINTYTDIYPILVAGRVLMLIHLAAKDNFEDARLVVVIVVTLCVIIRANTGTCTTCLDNTTTKTPPPRRFISGKNSKPQQLKSTWI